eukprot:UN00652
MYRGNPSFKGVMQSETRSSYEINSCAAAAFCTPSSGFAGVATAAALPCHASLSAACKLFRSMDQIHSKSAVNQH